jgi:hypothetical protein
MLSPLVVFYVMEEWGEALFFCSVPDTTRDQFSDRKYLSLFLGQLILHFHTADLYAKYLCVYGDKNTRSLIFCILIF